MKTNSKTGFKTNSKTNSGKSKFFDEMQESLKRLKPADMESALGLRRPIFAGSTNYGHFSRADLPWEQLDPARLAILKGE